MRPTPPPSRRLCERAPLGAFATCEPPQVVVVAAAAEGLAECELARADSCPNQVRSNLSAKSELPNPLGPCDMPKASATQHRRSSNWIACEPPADRCAVAVAVAASSDDRRARARRSQPELCQFCSERRRSALLLPAIASISAPCESQRRRAKQWKMSFARRNNGCAMFARLRFARANKLTQSG